MKRFSRLVCIFLATLLVIAAPAAATGDTMSRASSYFMSSDVYLYQTTSTKFQAWFEVTALGGMEKLGAKEIKIQKSSDGESWTTVKTCSMNDYSNLIREDTSIHASYVTYTGQAGYYYRAKIVLYAKNSSGYGEWTRYTSSVLL